MRRYKLAIFDFDGTLFATHKAIIHCIMKTFETFKKPAPSSDAIYLTITKGIPLEDTFKLLRAEQGEADPVNAGNEWVDLYRDIYKSEGESKTQPFDHARAALEHITKSGIPIVVISNKGTDAINSALAKYDLSQFITLVIGDTKGMKKKPDPMVFEQIIKPKFSDIRPTEIIVVGDTSADLSFAKNIGADACWAKYGYGAYDECSNLNSTYSIDGLDEIKSIISLQVV